MLQASRARLGFIRNVSSLMPSGQQCFADEKKPAMGRAGWESQKELDSPYAKGCENIVRGRKLLLGAKNGAELTNFILEVAFRLIL
jgi:hypothetical protein